MILRGIGLALLLLALIALTVASWQVGGAFLLSAVILGAAYAVVRSVARSSTSSSPSPPDHEGEWAPRPRKRDPASPD